MKAVWNSNAPWSVSGYGQQTALFVPRLSALGHDIAVSCFFGLEGGCLEWNGMRCYPTDHTRFGANLLGQYADHHGEGDHGSVTAFLLQDVWVLLSGIQNFQGIPVATWCPVDHDPIPPLVKQFLERSGAKVIAMSKFGERAINDAGIETMYCPHGVDTQLFKPEPEMRAEYRAGLKLPQDAFVVGMVGNNQGIPSRKAFPQVFEAFKPFQAKHPDALLYLHADVFGRNNGINLIEMGKAIGIPDSALRTSDQLSMHLGIPQDLMAGVFNCFDVLCMPSYGEGFGIPLIEAQACGVPVITNDWTAMPELVGAGWLTDGDRWYDPTQGSFQKIPRIIDIYDAMEEAYENAAGLQPAAREFALGYDIDRVVAEHMAPAWDVLSQPVEVAPLANRATRRAVKKAA